MHRADRSRPLGHRFGMARIASSSGALGQGAGEVGAAELLVEANRVSEGLLVIRCGDA